jgi:K+-sensing histidine kinase KdpD
VTDLELGDLYASLLHEMKNNLVLVTVTLDRIERTGAPSHDQALEEARLLCRKASERLMQALLIYKVDAGGIVLNAVDAYSTEDFASEMAMQARSLRSELEVTTDVASDVPAIWFFDRNLLEMALINGLHNSIVYARHRVAVVVRMVDGMLSISIRDDSDGYPPHILEAVHEDKPLKSAGTGLGLRFASLIAKAHRNEDRQGALHLSNDGGAVFEIRLP